jgi:tetratricopeptide (TPR) repeat protein
VSGVFINYRGDDSDTAAVLIDRELSARLGSDRVFLDSRSILAGTDFAEEILGRLRACSVLLVVIGPRWLTLTDEAGRRLIDDTQDWVRREIVEALARGLRVIPVLTGDAALPTEADLPTDIAALIRRQFVLLRRRYTPVDLPFLVERIAEADPELAKVAARRQSAAGRVPQQLPAAVVHFAGRAGELAMLTGLLRSRAEHGGTVVISAIGGTAGVGKTALAIYWAHQVADRFPDGQLYVNLRGFDPSGQVMAPAEAVRRFLDALQVPPERIPVDLDAQAALYRSQLAGKRMLVVLDNARDAEQVRPLLPGASSCLVVVTSRNQLTGLIAAEDAHPITLDLLTAAEAGELLSRRIGSDRTVAEPQAVQEIITRCARLPLTLAIVAARAASHPHFPLHTLAAELREAGDRLDAFAGDDPYSDVRAVFSWSYHALTPEAARLFRLLGLHPGPDLSIPAAASLAGLPSPQVRPMLTELARANLIVEHTQGRYTFHDLLRVYAAGLTHTTDPDPQRHAATHRVLDHYLHTAYTAERLLQPGRDPFALTSPQPGAIPEHPADYDQALAWFTTEHAVLLTAVEHAAATWFDAHTWQLAWTLVTYLDRRGHWHDLAATGRAAVAAAYRLADLTAQARAHHNLAAAYTRLGSFDDAHTHLRHALDLYGQVGDLVGQAHTHNGLAHLWGRRGRHVEALQHARQALDLYTAAGHKNGQARALDGVGWFHALLGDHRQALTCCQQALTLLQELDDRVGQASAWGSLGYAQHHLGHHTQAITSYHHALDRFRDLGDRYYEAAVLTHLGDTHHAADQLDQAHTAWTTALDILEDLDHLDAEKVRAKLHELDLGTT